MVSNVDLAVLDVSMPRMTGLQAAGARRGSAPRRRAAASLASGMRMLGLAARTRRTIDVRVKRVYDAAEPGDGYRVLIDHVWPRGVSHERANLDEWARELAPSDELRRWFDHIPERFDEFRSRYRGELAAHGERLEDLRRRARKGPVTIVYAARDRDHNNAVVLAELVHDR